MSMAHILMTFILFNKCCAAYYTAQTCTQQLRFSVPHSMLNKSVFKCKTTARSRQTLDKRRPI